MTIMLSTEALVTRNPLKSLHVMRVSLTELFPFGYYDIVETYSEMSMAVLFCFCLFVWLLFFLRSH